MRYADGREVLVGDVVDLGGGSLGRVVAVLDTQLFSEQYPYEDWGYLRDGVLVEASSFGLLHCTGNDHDFTLVGRTGSGTG